MASNNTAVRALTTGDLSLVSYGPTEIFLENWADWELGKKAGLETKGTRRGLGLGGGSGEPQRGELRLASAGKAPSSPLKVLPFSLGL